MKRMSRITSISKTNRSSRFEPIVVTGVLDRRPSDHPVREVPNPTLVCNNFLMCGRYRLSRRKQVVEEYFDTVPVEHDWNPRYNIAPTQDVPVIRQNPTEPVREMSFVRWGLIPWWAKNSSVSAKMINARTRPDGRRTKAILSTCRPPTANDSKTPAAGNTIARTSSAPFVVVASGKAVASGIRRCPCPYLGLRDRRS